MTLPKTVPLAAKYAMVHLLLCATVALASVGIVLSLWYPLTVAPILGVGKILAILIVADVVCGPLLTFILVKPSKSSRELRIDMTLVVALQLGALIFGLWSLYAARPVAIAFEVDRFVVVTANQVQSETVDPDAESQIQRDTAGLQIVSLRAPRSSIEYLESIDQSMQGVTPAMRPSWWRPLKEAHLEIGARAKPLGQLIHHKPHNAAELRAQASKIGIEVESLRYLPLVSSRSLEWIALLDPADNIVGRVNVDGFD